MFSFKKKPRVEPDWFNADHIAQINARRLELRNEAPGSGYIVSLMASALATPDQLSSDAAITELAHRAHAASYSAVVVAELHLEIVKIIQDGAMDFPPVQAMAEKINALQMAATRKITGSFEATEPIIQDALEKLHG